MSGTGIYGFMIFIMVLVFWRRTRAMVRPIKGSGMRMLLPIVYILPGIYAFLGLPSQLKGWEFGAASLVGVLLAIPLIVTTNFEIRQDGHIYAQKNIAFFIALIAVLAIRIAARQYFSGMDPVNVMTLFFTVAVSYVVPWRIISFVKFRQVKLLQASSEDILTIKGGC